jgi:hypothetical protein
VETQEELEPFNQIRKMFLEKKERRKHLDVPSGWRYFVSELREKFEIISWDPIDDFLPEEDCGHPSGQLLLFGTFFVHIEFSWLVSEEGDDSYGEKYFLDAAIDASDPSVGLFNAFDPEEKPRIFSTREKVIEVILKAALEMEESAKAEAEYYDSIQE